MSKSFVKKLVQTWSSWNYLEQSLACDSLNACNITLNLKENYAFKNCVKKSFMSLPEEIIVSKDSALVLSFSKGLLILTKTMEDVPFDENEIEKFMLKFGPLLKDLSFEVNINILLIVKQSKVEGKKLEDFMYLLINSIRKDMKNQTSIKLLSEMATILADANAQTFIEPSICYEILDTAKNNQNSEDLKYYINIILQMAKMGIIKDVIVSDLFNSANKFKPFLEAVLRKASVHSTLFENACLNFLSCESETFFPPSIKSR